MRIYLDNCCFNRPFDNQSQVRVRLETEAKLRIQERVANGEVELAWSYILDFENSANPFDERREAIASWRQRAVVDIEETAAILDEARRVSNRGLRPKDALHVACAVAARCDYLITTDDTLLVRLEGYTGLRSMDPTAFVRATE